ncbi:MarR family winged helix-turn-helix transcriptional regulator [Stackebrandtia soli]|uniref:MarR family winged helix-turn-helix transcriptional regulator n=1 Tax=Stackebrandtia soli TaxID=1892856 RepID=UPI0039ED1323
MVDEAIRRVEVALTVMASRVHKVHLLTGDKSHRLERSAYNVLGRLFDEGPRRLSDLAAVFGLDISTVSRQVQSLEAAGLVTRERDPADGRAHLLRLTSAGETAMRQTRNRRRGILRDLLGSWPDDDVATFAELLERFDSDMRARIGEFSRSQGTDRPTANTGPTDDAKEL